MKIADRLHTIQRLFLDTAPIIYYVEANPNYLIRIEPIFASLDADGLVAVTSPITLAECLIMPYRYHHLGLQQAFSDLIIRGSNVLFIPIHDAIATKAAQLRAHYNLTLTDALQIAVALETRCDAFLTHLHSPFKKSLINRKVADQTNGEWHYMLVVEGRKVG